MVCVCVRACVCVCVMLKLHMPADKWGNKHELQIRFAQTAHAYHQQLTRGGRIKRDVMRAPGDFPLADAGRKADGKESGGRRGGRGGMHDSKPRSGPPARPMRDSKPRAGVERLTFTAHPAGEGVDYEAVTGWTVLKPMAEGAAGPGDGEYDPSELCAIMCTELGDDPDDPVVLLPCSHHFNRDTLLQCFESAGGKCPICSYKFPLPGPQPSGTLEVKVDDEDCAGHRGVGTIVLDYGFPPGTQLAQHKRPGESYEGCRRTAYIPNTPEGRKAADLLKKVFLAGKMFMVGDSVTSSKKNQTVYAGVHIKTKRKGGAENHGWPDPTWFERMAGEAFAQGIMHDDDEGIGRMPPSPKHDTKPSEPAASEPAASGPAAPDPAAPLYPKLGEAALADDEITKPPPPPPRRRSAEVPPPAKQPPPPPHPTHPAGGAPPPHPVGVTVGARTPSGTEYSVTHFENPLPDPAAAGDAPPPAAAAGDTMN